MGTCLSTRNKVASVEYLPDAVVDFDKELENIKGADPLAGINVEAKKVKLKEIADE
jgi:hypothetical protein